MAAKPGANLIVKNRSSDLTNPTFSSLGSKILSEAGVFILNDTYCTEC